MAKPDLNQDVNVCQQCLDMLKNCSNQCRSWADQCQSPVGKTTLFTASVVCEGLSRGIEHCIGQLRKDGVEKAA